MSYEDVMKAASKGELEETAMLVAKTADKINDLIISEISGRPHRESWILKSRILNLVFGHHYSLTMSAAHNRIVKTTLEQETSEKDT